MINIKADSRKIKKGDIFIALRGISSDGHDYIEKAIELGASKLIVEENRNYSIPYEVVEDTRKYLEDYLKHNYNKYLDEMNIIGITGTNGKTTTSFLINQMLNDMNIKCAYIGTVGYYLGKEKIQSLPNTSPDICDMYDMIINAYDKGYRNIVVEASSQGLIKNRLKNISFNYAIFTNLTEDHLDEHKTMENYALAKKMLFDNLKKDGISIINFDDEYKKYYYTNNTITYGFKGGDYKVINYNCYNNGTTFEYEYNKNKCLINSPLLGKYNIYNSLAVIIILENMGIKINEIKENIQNSKCPPGRMDITRYQSNSIIIDYAHTPDAMDNILSTVKNIKHNDTYIVFGCTGDRERMKRPIMMNLATENAKYVIVTIDDPHNEDPHHIVDDMLENNRNDNYEVILDRKKAIEKGISLLNENDILLVLGKGHEEFIIMRNKRIPFNDKEVVEEILERVEI